jgi:acyl-coenzyme A thioesterase PaaI-like protein
MVDPATHLGIDASLCGRPERLSPGQADVVLDTSACMRADAQGLVHGGFVFGLADYAAMLAVNHPNVVLGAANVRFTAPVALGQRLRARAVLVREAGRRREVEVEVTVIADSPDTPDDIVLAGTFHCAVLDRHVLARGDA